MPAWIESRATHILAKNPSMPKSEAWAISTQQAHALGKSPKGYGTVEGRAAAKAKFDTPKDDKKTANPGHLESPKMAGATILPDGTGFFVGKVGGGERKTHEEGVDSSISKGTDTTTETTEDQRKLADVEEPHSAVKTELLPHQQRVVGRLQRPDQPGLVVAHGLGSGKTLTSIAAQEALQMPSTVVAPAALLGNYKKERQLHLQGPRQPAKMQSMQMAALKGGVAPNPLMIVDEAHRARDTSTKTYKALSQNTADKRMLLTGSPFYNHPSDIAPLINIAAGKDVLPSDRGAFEDRFIKNLQQSPSLWGSLVRGETGGTVPVLNQARAEELRGVLGKWVDHHPGSKENFPDVEHETVRVPMTDDQLRTYDTLMGHAPPWVAAKIRSGLPPSKQEAQQLNSFLSGTRQASNTTVPFDNTGIGHSPKIQRAFEEMQKTLGENERAKGVVYSNYLDAGINPYKKHLENAGIPFGEFTGEMSQNDRNELVKQYNANKLRVLMLSSAGGEGLDLKGTRLLQVLEPHWNEEKLKQVEGRGARYKSHDDLPPEERKVRIQHFLATRPKSGIMERLGLSEPGHSVDEYLSTMSANKTKLIDQFKGLLSTEKVEKEASFKLQGHIEHQGLSVAVENRKGSVRKGVDKDGKPWRTVMKHPYGYLVGTKGNDGEEVDVFVGPKKDAPNAYVVHQHKHTGKGYDEDKVLLGFESLEAARQAYLKHYNDPKFLGPISEVSVERLKEMVEEGKPMKKIALTMPSFAGMRQGLNAAAGRVSPTLAKPVGQVATQAAGAVKNEVHNLAHHVQGALPHDMSHVTPGHVAEGIGKHLMGKLPAAQHPLAQKAMGLIPKALNAGTNFALGVPKLADFEKKAFGLEDAKKVFQATKKVAIKPPLSARPPMMNFAYVPTESSALKSLSSASKDFGIPLNDLKQRSAQMLDTVKGFGGHVMVPPSGDATSFLHGMARTQRKDLNKNLRYFPELKPVMDKTRAAEDAFASVGKSPKDRQLLEGIIKSHELSEASVRPQHGAAQFGHRSPDVILREQNAVATLPHDSPVRAAMSALRAGNESEMLKNVGVDYGAQRFSRHARKHLTNMIEAPVVSEARKALHKQVEPGGIEVLACLNELAKLGTISDEQAIKALERYEDLEKTNPTTGQIARYGALGAVTAPVGGAISSVISGQPVFGGGGLKQRARGALGAAVGGAIGMGGMPLLRQHLDRAAEMRTLKSYMQQPHLKSDTSANSAGKLSAPFEPVEKAAFDVSQYSGPMGPVFFRQHSQVPGMKVPSLRSPVETPNQQIKTSGALTPAGRLTSTMKVGLPKVTAPPGPSIAQVAKPVGFGKPLAGANKGGI